MFASFLSPSLESWYVPSILVSPHPSISADSDFLSCLHFYSRVTLPVGTSFPSSISCHGAILSTSVNFSSQLQHLVEKVSAVLDPLAAFNQSAPTSSWHLPFIAAPGLLEPLVHGSQKRSTRCPRVTLVQGRGAWVYESPAPALQARPPLSTAHPPEPLAGRGEAPARRCCQPLGLAWLHLPLLWELGPKEVLAHQFSKGLYLGNLA